MADDGPSRWDTALDGLFVLLGVGYLLDGAPVFGVDPLYVGGALAAYGATSFVGRRIAHYYGLPDRD